MSETRSEAPTVILLKNARGGSLRSHFERLLLEEDININAIHQKTESQKVARKASAQSVSRTEDLKPLDEESKTKVQEERPQGSLRSATGAQKRLLPFDQKQDGTMQFEDAVQEVLHAFEEGRDVGHILQHLPAYSMEVDGMTIQELCDQLKRLVTAYEQDSVTCHEAVALQYQVWRATFLPLAVLMEAWSRTTGIATVFYLDAFQSLVMGLVHRDIGVDVAGFDCRSRYWSVGTAQPGSGKSPAIDSIVRCLCKVLHAHYDIAPGHKWDKFHVIDPMTHCAAIDKLKVTNGYGTIVSGEGGPLLCPAWPTSATWNQTTHINLARFLDSANGGAVPWETAIDRKHKKDAAEEQVDSQGAEPVESTNVTIALLQQESIFLQWWVAGEQKSRIGLPQRCVFSFGAAREPGPPKWQGFEENVVMPILSRVFEAILKTIGPKAALATGSHWAVSEAGRAAFHRYRLACTDVNKSTRFGESFATGLNKSPYLVSTMSLFGTLMEGLWGSACDVTLGRRLKENNGPGK